MRSTIASMLVAASLAYETIQPREFEFMKFISKWNKSYGTREEFKFRMEQWIKIDDFIAEVNDPNSEHTHTAAHNKFSDWTREEYEKLMGLKNQPMPETTETFDAPEGYVSNGSKNWTTCVTAVKNQGQCGSCYSFSATEVSESSYCISTGTLYTMSEQVIVDCSSAYGN